LTVRIASGLAAGLLLAAGALALTADSSSATDRVRGIDVSRFQGKINWARVGQTRIRFAYVQASRGSGGDCTVISHRCGADEFFRRNRSGAKRVGIRVGAYHRAFATGATRRRARRDARAEARVFSANIGELGRRELLPALDVEVPFGDLSHRRLRVWIRTWLRRVERALGARPMIYTNSSSWQATGNATRFARAGHQLWVAHWGVSRPAVPARNWAGRGWSVWQFTSDGRVRGIDGRVDRNRLGAPLRRIGVR
jgi:GH25 family lysozyme M1 (1,4-beta-N-acetylmuramidase)